MPILFSDIQGIVHQEFAPEGQTVNAGFYCSVLRCMREDIQRKRPELWQEGNWLFHDDNAPSHRALVTCEFLAQNSIITLPHPPYSPDLAPCDFFLFPKMKLQLKGHRFDRVEKIQLESQNVLGMLRGLPACIPAVATALGSMCSCKRGIFWRRCCSNFNQVNTSVSIGPVLELFDTPLYGNSIEQMHCLCWITGAAHTHTHTHRICNNYCFSTSTAVRRTHLNVHCLSCYSIKSSWSPYSDQAAGNAT